MAVKGCRALHGANLNVTDDAGERFDDPPMGTTSKITPRITIFVIVEPLNPPWRR